ncbi:MAG: Permease YjgP/YjgQ family protein [Pedosphaera sp.]|nr:Permease YjgP/YjgQ family protein [Pedosphaera sp.]
MRLLDRYLLRELLVPLGYCLGAFLTFVIAFSLFSELNKYQEHKLLVSDVVELYVVRVPGNLVLILPIALLCSLLYALTNHARYNELTAMRAAGVSLWRISVPYLFVGLLMSFALFVMNEKWVPDSADKEEEIMSRRTTTRVGGAVVRGNLAFRIAREGREWLMTSYNLETSTMMSPKVIWTLPDGSWRTFIADRGEWVNGVWTFYGSSIFSVNDITNLTEFATRLKQPSEYDQLSQYIATQLWPATKNLLSTYSGGTNLQLQAALVADLNRVAQHGLIYDARRFADVKLSEEAAKLVGQKLQPGDVPWLNRTLLMDAYPEEMSKYRSSFTVQEFEAAAGSTNAGVPILQTNVLALPEFSETPDQIKREIKFSTRLTVHSAASTEVPVLEIIEYLKLHPRETSRNKWWLLTQLHGRLAAPWTCLVVVLIAIPFGAASGRRNVFVGVASSIVICFVYFVLLKLGLALGTGGYVPAWIAAWLPNLTFSIAGAWMMLRVR